jgi:nucleotide-binding universal stress UspA family protein
MPETESIQAQYTAAPASTAPIFAKLLCGIRGKEGGFAAVAQAAALAGTQGRLTLLAVTSFRSAGAHRAPEIGPARATEILNRAEGIAREAGVPYASEVDSRSPPARVILDWSEGYDLLALGAPASSWPAMWLSVGVGNKAIEGFTTPLLVARPLAAERRFADRIVVASDGLEGSHALVDLAARLAHACCRSTRTRTPAPASRGLHLAQRHPGNDKLAASCGTWAPSLLAGRAMRAMAASTALHCVRAAGFGRAARRAW